MGNSCTAAPGLAVLPQGSNGRSAPGPKAAAAVLSGPAEIGKDQLMQVVEIKKAQVAHPTGDPNFAVMQPFPAGIRAEDADPFLMCDEFGPSVSDGPKAPGGWHGHLGMDIMTYLVKGRGAHADSLGNQVVYDSPGMQWMSVGSGIEHAEGGAAPKGETGHGFQIWINVPKEHKLDDPRYGTEVPESIPSLRFAGGLARLLAGEAQGHQGPFATTQPVQMMDVELDAGVLVTHALPEELNNCMLYVYRGRCTINGKDVSMQHVARLDASQASVRMLSIEAGRDGVSALLFAGKRIGEPIAWHGPFVMNTQAELRKAFKEYQMGIFPPKRVTWNYRKAAWNPNTALAASTQGA